MNIGTQVALGGLVVVGAGVGAYFLLKPKPQSSNSPVAASKNLLVNPITPSPSPNQMVSQDTALILQQQQQLRAEQERARLESEARAQAERERLKRDEIRGFEDRAAAVENLMMIDLTQIESIERDNSRFNDFEQLAYRDLLQTQAFKTRVKTCKQQVAKNCGFDFFGACNSDNQPKCENPSVDWSIQVSWARPESKRIAGEELAAWKYNEKVPILARLAERERTFQGIVLELKNRLGVVYNPRSPEAHYRAGVKETAPVVNKPL